MQIIIFMKVFSWSTGLHIPITQWHWQWHCDTQPFFAKNIWLFIKISVLSDKCHDAQTFWDEMRHKEECRVFEKKNCATLVLHSLHCYGSFDWNKKYSLKIWIEKSSECFYQMYNTEVLQMSSLNISIWLPECLGALRQTADICGEMIFRSRRRHSTNKKC